MNQYSSKRPQPPDDDGRTIASMDVEGMPWRMPRQPKREVPVQQGEPVDRKTLRRAMFSAVGAGLLITLVFGAAGAAFILFCTQVWFK